MRIRGVCYDAGVVMGVPWRPEFNARAARREMEIIRDDLNCSAVRIGARDVGRLVTAAEAALDAGLEVWLSPALWDRGADETLAYLERAAAAAERLRQRAPDRLVLVVGGELTLFMRGILPGRSLTARLGNPALVEIVRSGKHNEPLNAFLARTVTAARAVYHGPLTTRRCPGRRSTGAGSTSSASTTTARRGSRTATWRCSRRCSPRASRSSSPSLATPPARAPRTPARSRSTRTSTTGACSCSSLPVVGRFVRPRVTRIVPRDEMLQARELTETLGVLDGAGVDGAFINTFIFEISPYDEDPRYDLDACSAGLVRPLTGGRMGTSFPDMHWEPKEAFRSVAAYYESAGSLPTGNRPNAPGAAAVTLQPDSSVGTASQPRARPQ